MANLKKYNLNGEVKGEVAIDDSLLTKECNRQMMKDYLVAIRANKRQWSASTQTRAEVSHSKRKPYAQKGTGNARQGFLGSPQFRGGGRVHAPRPKFDQHMKVNRKERRLAIQKLLSDHIAQSAVCVLELPKLKGPKTQPFSKFLQSLDFQERRVLFLTTSNKQEHTPLSKSVRNLPKVALNFIHDASGYDLALCQQIVIIETAMESLKEILGSS